MFVAPAGERIRATLAAIRSVLAHHGATSEEYTAVDHEPLLMVLGMPQTRRPVRTMTDEEWEDLCRGCGGWEWVDSEARGKNEFGENVGLERFEEALEATEWDGGDIDAGNDIDGFETELELRDQSSPPEEFAVDADVRGMHEAILAHNEDGGNGDPGGDVQVQELENMMLKMQAIKEKGAGMAEDKRKRFAAKAVMEVMKSFESIV
ncbi:MAG: hypothetical protein Q9211_007043 [Gyalolechia sp. 1 TL-2023]